MNPNPAQEPGLSVRLDATWLAGILRVDQIRYDTLVSLVQHWDDHDARADIINQLDALADAVTSPREGELDGLIEAVESAAAMDDAQISIDLHAMRRLSADLYETAATVSRFGRAAEQNRSAK